MKAIAFRKSVLCNEVSAMPRTDHCLWNNVGNRVGRVARDHHFDNNMIKRFVKKIQRTISPKPSRQPIPPEKPTDIAARPPDLQTELDSVTIPGDGEQNVSDNDLEADHTDLPVPPDEGGTIGPRVLFQDGMDGNQEPPASRTLTSVVEIGGADRGEQIPSKYSWSMRWTQHSLTSVSLSPLAEGSGDTEGGTRPTETSTGM